MYIPPGLTFLRLLQFPSLLLGFDQSTSQPAQVNEDFTRHKDLNYLGNLSPYHDAPAVPGVSVDLPGDCTVDQVILLHRHGSRGPPSKSSEENMVKKLVSTLEAASKKIQEADLPPELQFLKDGYGYHLVPEDLTAIGRQQLLNHGVEFSLRYPTFSTNHIIATNVPRVVDSAYFFAQGFFGRKVDTVKFYTTKDCPECHSPVSWLEPWEHCPNIHHGQLPEATQWINKYVPPIRDRLNKLVPGVGFDLDDIQGALYACPYDLAARGKSPWCNVFTLFELRDLEYQFDLYADIVTGHDTSKDPGPLVGAFYVQNLVDRLTNVTGKAESLYLDFAHDYTILFALSAMRLNKDAHPLTPDHPLWDRKFRSSNEAPFAGNMIWEKFTCKKSFTGPQVRLLLNGATYPLTNCQKSAEDERYGTCSLEAFKQANKWSLDVQYNSTFWNATCGHNTLSVDQEHDFIGDWMSLA